MKTIKLITLTEEEKKEIEISYKELEKPQVTLEEVIKKNNNQTYAALKHIGNARGEWKDIEDMVTYTNALKKINAAKGKTVSLDNDEVKLIKKVMQEAVKSKKFGFSIDKMAEVYESFS